MMESFNPLLLFGAMGGILIVGLLCRAYIPIFQKFLVPASVIGGILGFIIVSFGWFGLKAEMFKMFAFHLFNASFIAMGLTGGDGNSAGASRRKTILKGSLWLGLASTILLCVQGILGGGIVYLINLVTGSESYPGLGMLVGHGFLQGPGQAMAIGGAWQSEFGIPDAQTIALTFSAFGFLIASFVGVPLANWGIRKGYATHKVDALRKDFLTGIKAKDEKDMIGRETVHSSNAGTFTLHLALIAVTYLASYGVCSVLIKVIGGTPIGQLVYGFFFIWGLFTAMIVREIIDVTGHGYLIDNSQMKQFTSIFVDFLMVATMMAISVEVVMNYIVIIVSAVLVCALFTLLFVLYFGRRIGQFDLERMLVLFGSGTGTIPSGLVLLRIVDPGFKTTAAVESGTAQLVLTVTMMHLITIAGILPKSFTVIQAMGIWGITALVSLILMKVLRVWNTEKSF